MNKDSLYISHIKDAIKKIEVYSIDMKSDTDLASNFQAGDAIIHQIQIIGEASKRLSEDFKKSHAGVEWRNIAGVRDKIVHDYFGMDYKIIWSIVADELPKLKGILD
jgi:uncharacterized protein with HEPN domain